MSYINALYPNPREPSASVFDDLTTSPGSAVDVGASKPILMKWADNGAIPSGPALRFDGSNDRVAVAYYAGMDSIVTTQQMTLAAWIKTDSEEDRQYIFRRVGQVDISLRWGEVTCVWENQGERWSGPAIVVGQRHHLCLVFEWDSGATEMVLTGYLDGFLFWSETWYNVPAATDTSGFSLGHTSSSFNGLIDAFVWYNVALTPAQVAELYNGGSGTLNHPLGIVVADDCVAKLEMEEGSGATTDNNSILGDGIDGAITGAIWETPGLIAGTGGTPSYGVFVKAMDKTANRPLIIERQFPHRKKIGSVAPFHIHWAKTDDQAGDVVWYVEYQAAPVSGVFGNTTVVRAWTPISITPLPGNRQHVITPIFDMPGALVDPVSGIVNMTLFRDYSHPNDTYPGIVAFLSADFHVESDKSGSREEYIP